MGSMTTVLILGGGFGGLTCARALRAALDGGKQIVIVDRAPRFHVGATKTWVMLGERDLAAVTRERRSLVPEGVDVVQSDVVRIDTAARAVQTTMGPLQGEFLVIALGSEPEMSAVPGLSEAAHSFYDLEGALRLRAALASFAGGRIVLLIPRVPFPCPPGPYEALLLIHESLVRRGCRERSQLDVWTVEAMPMATAGPEIGAMVVGLLEERGIGFHPRMRPSRVDPAGNVVHFESGMEAPFDLLIAVPPHRVPRVVVDSGLARPDGWIPVDPLTMALTGTAAAPNVYAIGDVTSVPLPGRWSPETPLALPKAGVMAAAQGEVVASNIAAVVRGDAPRAAFDGAGACYIEVGGNRALRGAGRFFAVPHPEMRAEPAAESLYQEKLAWVEGMIAPRR